MERQTGSNFNSYPIQFDETATCDKCTGRVMRKRLQTGDSPHVPDLGTSIRWSAQFPLTPALWWRWCQGAFVLFGFTVHQSDCRNVCHQCSCIIKDAHHMRNHARRRRQSKYMELPGTPTHPSVKKTPRINRTACSIEVNG